MTKDVRSWVTNEIEVLLLRFQVLSFHLYSQIQLLSLFLPFQAVTFILFPQSSYSQIHASLCSFSGQEPDVDFEH